MVFVVVFVLLLGCFPEDVYAQSQDDPSHSYQHHQLFLLLLAIDFLDNHLLFFLGHYRGHHRGPLVGLIHSGAQAAALPVGRAIPWATP